MADPSPDRFSAGEQGLGYIYQPRFALLKLMQLDEDTCVLIEKDDDLDFVAGDGTKTLASLKHKAAGDRLTDLSTDFWKSVRIWLERYIRDGKATSKLRFFLFTTGAVAEASFLRRFLPEVVQDDFPSSLVDDVADALSRSTSKLIVPIKEQFDKLDEDEKADFLLRITIFQGGPRIDDVAKIIKDQHMRSIRRDTREAVFERLEGWWNELIINLLTGKRTDPAYGYEVSDKLAAIADEYKSDNLPITFTGRRPAEEIDPDTDSRLFVLQLRAIGSPVTAIQTAILDYYRAFAQRSEWTRKNLLVSGEMEQYEDRLVDEWSRYRDLVFEKVDASSAEAIVLEAGRTLYNWSQFQCNDLRIRERVTEPYVIRGGFHILANGTPEPRIYWHPRFLEKIKDILSGAAA